jgi:hypothetical protein
MIKKIYLVYLTLALLTSTAAICTAQSLGEGNGDWTNSDWVNGYEGGNDQSTNSWGPSSPAEVSEPSEGAYFPVSISESPLTLVEETMSYQYDQANIAGGASGAYAWNYAHAYAGGTGTSKNLFWIISRDGARHWYSINILCHSYARMLIIPSTSGQLIMEELYPDGNVRSYNFGNVKANTQYRVWFYADTSGTHRMRYRIGNCPYSDILTFHVGPCDCGGCGGCRPCPPCPRGGCGDCEGNVGCEGSRGYENIGGYDGSSDWGFH